MTNGCSLVYEHKPETIQRKRARIQIFSSTAINVEKMQINELAGVVIQDICIFI